MPSSPTESKYPPEASDEVLRIVRQVAPDFRPEPGTWPSHYPAYSRVSVDDTGHVFAFRYAPQAGTLDDVLVDIFDQLSGDFVASAAMKNVRWLHSDDDFVFAPALDPDTLEYGIARYRLELPW